MHTVSLDVLHMLCQQLSRLTQGRPSLTTVDLLVGSCVAQEGWLASTLLTHHAVAQTVLAFHLLVVLTIRASVLLLGL